MLQGGPKKSKKKRKKFKKTPYTRALDEKCLKVCGPCVGHKIYCSTLKEDLDTAYLLEAAKCKDVKPPQVNVTDQNKNSQKCFEATGQVVSKDPRPGNMLLKREREGLALPVGR